MRHSQVVLLAEEQEIQNSAPGGWIIPPQPNPERAHEPDLDNPNLELICHSYCIPHTCPYTCIMRNNFERKYKKKTPTLPPIIVLSLFVNIVNI